MTFCCSINCVSSTVADASLARRIGLIGCAIPDLNSRQSQRRCTDQLNAVDLQFQVRRGLIKRLEMPARE